MSKQVDFNNLTYKFSSPNLSPINFIGFKGSIHICNNIKNGNTSIEKYRKRPKAIDRE